MEGRDERKARIRIHSDDPKDHEANINTLDIDKVAPKHYWVNEFGRPCSQRFMTIDLSQKPKIDALMRK